MAREESLAFPINKGGIIMKKVCVIGACGKMGRETCKTIINNEKMELSAVFDIFNEDKDIGSLLGMQETGVKVISDINKLLMLDFDVAVDFSNAEAANKNIPVLLEKGVDVIVGTTGLTEELENIFDEKARKVDRALLIAPNFAIGAVLMMRFAVEAAKYMPHVEIIEMHHDQKLDAPSGTAIKTLKDISAIRKEFKQGHPDERETISASRGGDYKGIRVHSVRLPGYVAHQEVILGDLGQVLTIRHDSINRESFMPGVVLAIENIDKHKGFIYGLEKII